MKTLSVTPILLFLLSISLSGIAYSHSVEFKRIYFPDDRPRKNESSDDLSVILDKEQLDNLEQLLEALKERPHLGAKVLGFSDADECRPSDCADLSLRRASVVFDWLLKHGLPAEQLKGPEGLSTAWPLYKEATEEEKGFNRRVTFEPFTLTGS